MRTAGVHKHLIVEEADCLPLDQLHFPTTPALFAGIPGKGADSLRGADINDVLLLPAGAAGGRLAAGLRLELAQN